MTKEKTLEEELRELPDATVYHKDDSPEIMAAQTEEMIKDILTPKVQKYVRRIDCTEGAVNALLDLGYSLKAVTPVTQEYIRKDGYHISYEVSIIYHFILEG